MEGLPRAFFELMSTYVDGRTAARWRGVCKAWQHHVDRTPRLCHRIACHYILAERHGDMDSNIDDYSKYRIVSCAKATTFFDNFLYVSHEFNGYIIHPRNAWVYGEPINFFAQLGWEPRSRYARERKSGDLIIFFERYCYGRREALLNDTPEYEHMHWLETQVLRGALTWRLVATNTDMKYIIRIRNPGASKERCRSIRDMLRRDANTRKKTKTLTETDTQLLKRRRLQ